MLNIKRIKFKISGVTRQLKNAATRGNEKKKKCLLWLVSAVQQRPYLCRMTIINLLVQDIASMSVCPKKIKDKEGFIH